MTANSNLQEIVAKLQQLGRTTTYRDLDESDSFDAQLAALVANFLNLCPFVKQDRGYIDFLSYYGGALVGDAGDSISLGIYGFSDQLCPYILQPPIVDKDGFFTFADLLLLPRESEEGSDEQEINMAFSFDATGTRLWGVYRRIDDQPDRWYCKEFLELLEKLVEYNGRLPDEIEPAIK